MQAQHVAHRQKPVILVMEHRTLLHLLRQPLLVPVMHLHPEPPRHPSQLPPDPPHPENPQPPPRNQRPLQLRRRPPPPSPGPNHPLPLPGPPRRRQYQQHRALRRGHAQHVRRVHQRDPSRPQRRNIHMVIPHAERPHHLHRLRQPPDHLRTQLLRRATQHRRRPRRPRDDLLCRHHRIIHAKPSLIIPSRPRLYRFGQPPRHIQHRLHPPFLHFPPQWPGLPPHERGGTLP